MFFYFTFLLGFFKFCLTDNIISMTLTNSTVSYNTTLTAILSLTNNASNIIFSLPIDFTITSSSCTINTAKSSCIINSSSTSTNITFTGNFVNQISFAFNVTNPNYESNFQIFTYNGNITIGGGSYIIATLAYQAVCSLQSSSQIVGAQSTGVFSMNLLSVPSGGLIYLTFPIQTIFPQMISNINSLNCTSSLVSSLNCGLSSLDSNDYVIGISNMFQSSYAGGTITFNISTMVNPPYNSTFGNILLQVTNTNGQNMEYCNLQQPEPTILATSSFSFTNWNSTINVQSTVNFNLIPKTTLPANFSLLLVYPLQLSLYVNPPATTQTTNDTNYHYITINNLTISNKIINFYFNIKNPSSVISLPMAIYISYNSTYFIQKVNISTFTLAMASLNITSALSTYLVMATSTLTLTINFVDIISNGSVIIQSQLGSFLCSSNISINAVIFVPNICNTTYISLQVSNLSGITNIVLSYVNPLSTNSNTITVSTFSSLGNSISQGSSVLNFNQSVFVFTVNNLNLVLNAATTVTVQQVNNTYITNQRRIIYLSLPTNLQLGSVSVKGNINSFSISGYILQIDLNGTLQINITNINNPNLYNGTKIWGIVCQDPNGYSISQGSAFQSTQYTPVIPKINFSFTSLVIQDSDNLTISINEQLNHYYTDVIVVSLTSCQINTPCINKSCSMPNSSSVSFGFVSNLSFISVITNPSVPASYVGYVSILSNTSILLQYQTFSFVTTQMKYNFNYSFSGYFSQQGILNVNVTKGPSSAVSIYYNTSNIFSTSTCINCTSNILKLQGIVLFFTSQVINFTGSLNNVIYAYGSITVLYPCAVGCEICNGSICTQCFNSTYTNNIFFFNGSCLTTCPSSTYLASLTCISCSSNCYTCNASQCSVCLSNYVLYSGACMSSCPSGYVINGSTCIVQPVICANNCSLCISLTQCLTCNTNLLIYNGICLSSCPTGYISNSTNCVLPPTPLQSTNYLPFPFLISSMILFVILLFFRRFDKRSLIIGNFIAFATLLQLGTILLFLSYVLKQAPSILSQALSFIGLFSKFGFNLFFLIYFIRKISQDQIYQKWLEKEKIHKAIQITVMVLTVGCSFQTFRVLYSRLLGIQIFFARFSNSLIFKPLSYLNYAYYFTTSASFIIIAVMMLYNQHTVQTSQFFSSLEIIIMETLLFVMCIIDDRKNTEDLFDYQIYRIQNQFTADKINAVQQQSHMQVRCNIKDQPHSEEAAFQSSESQNTNYAKQTKNIFQTDSKSSKFLNQRNHIDFEKKRKAKLQFEKFAQQISERHKDQKLFRQKIIDQWRQLKYLESKNKSNSQYMQSGRKFSSLNKTIISYQNFDEQLKNFRNNSAEKFENIKSVEKKQKILRWTNNKQKNSFFTIKAENPFNQILSERQNQIYKFQQNDKQAEEFKYNQQINTNTNIKIDFESYGSNQDKKNQIKVFNNEEFERKKIKKRNRNKQIRTNSHLTQQIYLQRLQPTQRKLKKARKFDQQF